MVAIFRLSARFALICSLFLGAAVSAQGQASNQEIQDAILAELTAQDLSPDDLTEEQAQALVDAMVSQFGEEAIVGIVEVLVQVSPTPQVASVFVAAAVSAVPSASARIMAAVPAEVQAVIEVEVESESEGETSTDGETDESATTDGEAGEPDSGDGASSESPASTPTTLPQSTVGGIQDVGNVISSANANN